MLHTKIDIWKDLDFQIQNNTKPVLTTYMLEQPVEQKKKLPAVIICPGGGYQYTSPREGEPIALAFNNANINAFVLDYSVAPYRYPQPLLDLARAISIVRNNCELWNIDSNKIYIAGFSAGGHLAASMGVLWDSDIFKNIKGINCQNLKPNKLILSYPVISSGEFGHQDSFKNLLGDKYNSELLNFLSLENRVSKNTPETFIWHTFEDGAVPMENSMLFVKQLREYKIPMEFHIYPKGGHGLSLAVPKTSYESKQVNIHVSSWFDQCISWLNQ